MSALLGYLKRNSFRVTPHLVRIVVQDEAGRCVWSTDDAAPGGPGRSAGWHEAAWDGRGDGGAPVAPGRYTAVIIAGDRADTEMKTVRLNVLDPWAGLGGAGAGVASGSGGPAGGAAASSGGAAAGGSASGSAGAAAASPSTRVGTIPALGAHDNGWHSGNNPNGFTIDHPDKSNGQGNNRH